MTVIKHCPLLAGRGVAPLQARGSAAAAAFKAVGLFGAWVVGRSTGRLTACLLNIIKNYRQNVGAILPDSGNQMSIAAEPRLFANLWRRICRLNQTTCGDKLRLDLIISNIITSGKSIVVEPRPH